MLNKKLKKSKKNIFFFNNVNKLIIAQKIHFNVYAKKNSIFFLFKNQTEIFVFRSKGQLFRFMKFKFGEVSV